MAHGKENRMELKVMTFNTQHCMNFITKKIDYGVMAEAIKACNPDIVALNEMRGKGTAEGYDAQVDILAKMADMKGYFAEAIRFEGENPYGNGLLSKFPILSAEVIPIPVPEVRPYKGYYEDRCLLKATLDIRGERLTVLVIHVGLNPDEAERAMQTILENLPSEKCVLMGDFNMKPDNPLLVPILDRMQDAAKQILGEAFTFPSDKPDRKIDYVFATPDIKISSASIPQIVASDHCPHTAILEF